MLLPSETVFVVFPHSVFILLQFIGIGDLDPGRLVLIQPVVDALSE